MTFSQNAISVRARYIVMGVAVLTALAWLWVCWCAYPDSAWNDLRLAPAFMLAHGISLYPPPHTGVITTWMYGPLPLLLLLPATWAASAYQAVLAAGAINIVATLAAILLVCWLWPAPVGRNLGGAGRALAAALTVFLWPWESFQFLQADNLAIALGLVSCLMLIRSRSDAPRWGAALLAVAGIACKQTSVGVIAGQIVWLWVTEGRSAAGRHFLRGLAGGLAILAVITASFSWPGVWFHFVVVPERIPWTVDPALRVWFHATQLAVQVLLPAAVLVFFRRAVWNRASPLLLPSLVWLCALPLGAAAFFKAGGSVNSLHGYALWLAPALVVTLAAAWKIRPAGWTSGALAIAVLMLAAWRLRRPGDLWWPTGGPYHEAAQLARELPGMIWFPCDPLFTVYSSHHFYDDEDGLFVRVLSGFHVRLRRVYAHLPPHLAVIALPRDMSTWGLAQRMGPADKKRTEFGYWTLYSWNPNASPGKKSRSGTVDFRPHPLKNPADP